MNDPATQLEGFIAKFSEEVAAQARAILARMGHLVPGAISLVYDNYNALAIGYGATDKQAGLVFSIAVYTRWVSLFGRWFNRRGLPGLEDYLVIDEWLRTQVRQARRAAK